MAWTVYKHTNLINQKVYIGITSRSPKARWGLEGRGYKGQPKFYNAIKKYGWEGFSHEILYTGLSEQDALLLESQLIKEYDSIKNGYNISPYGATETKRVLCLTTNQIFDSLEDAAAFAEISSSNLSHYLSGDYDTCGEFNGLKLEWEYLDFPEKNNQAKEKREQRKKKREEKFFTPLSLKIIEEYKNGVSLKQLEKKYKKSRESIKILLTFYGIPISSSKQRLSHPVYQLDKDRKIIRRYDTLTEAALAVGAGENNIGRIKKACNENWRQVKGFYWTWAEQLDIEVENAEWSF